MAKQYLYKISILNKKNSNPLEAISYYSGESQFDLLNNKSYISNSEDNVIFNSLLVPSKIDNEEKFNHLPEYLKFRNQKKDVISNARNILWQNVYSREVRNDAQFARLFELALPHFFEKENAIETVNKFANILIEEGMIVDFSIHLRNQNNISLIDKLKGNYEQSIDSKKNDYTCFIMCTLRDYENGIFVNKNRDWNSKAKMESWRKSWVEILTTSINLYKLDKQDKDDWENKLSIYSEYAEIIKTIKNKSNKELKII